MVLPWPFLEAGLGRAWWADPVPAKLDPAHVPAVSDIIGPQQGWLNVLKELIDQSEDTGL